MGLFKKIQGYKGHAEICFFLLGVVILTGGCTEPFKIEGNDLESFLVINATITDKMKKQEISLSRTFGFERNDSIDFEVGASVKVIENDAVEYPFIEISPGQYLSIQEFGATAGSEYQLSIQTQNGSFYSSSKVIAPKPTSIDQVSATRMINENGTEGVGVFLDAFDPNGTSLYYRYEFEETFRYRAPFWIGTDITAVIEDDDSVTLELIDRPINEQVCYGTRFSKEINVLNTTALTEDRVQDLLINFIPANDIKIGDRYSILVKQYVQTREANVFYKVLSDFSGSESVFSQIQPGSIIGNISSQNTPDENVIGYFDVSSIAEQRIFFDRDEFVGDLPVFNPSCDNIPIQQEAIEPKEIYLRRLAALVISDLYRLKEPPNGFDPECPTLVFARRICGDCTAVGKSNIPDFWID